MERLAWELCQGVVTGPATDFKEPGYRPSTYLPLFMRHMHAEEQGEYSGCPGAIEP